MPYKQYYDSPLGRIVLTCDDEGLTGLWFDGQKYFGSTLDREHEEKRLPVFEETERWLDLYFSGIAPDFTPKLLISATAFRSAVWKALLGVPYGQTVTYGQLARRAAQAAGRGKGSARAAGGAVSRNPVSLIIPCHRVVGADGRLTGYAGGVERKEKLLRMEGILR